MYPLTAAELEGDFELKRALVHGMIPLAYTAEDPRDFLESYIQVYLQEEIVQKGLKELTHGSAFCFQAAL
jgi:hypothetical protein